MMNTWRLLPFEVCSAAWNMAVDEAILQARIAEQVPNTLRLYRWSPSAVSVGRNETVDERVYLQTAQQLGVDVVRRCSGGGTVYHDCDGEVTYSVVAKVSNLGSLNDVTCVYFKIYEAIADALRLLGVSADFNTGDTKNCPNLTVGGKKISGSSQTLSKGYVLQHGTLLRTVDLDKMFQLLKLKDLSCTQAANIGRQNITSINDELGHPISPGTIANALKQGFKARLKIQLHENPLIPFEEKLAEQLYKEKYSTNMWTLNRKHS
ncbi:MAG: lipoate--protein ligase family protein [Nitrososphaerota archaeon]|jgi:lipoate-protein ligase A|nr:lipoate--protein ligase family protein [Nitrososphaerota archaeon]